MRKHPKRGLSRRDMQLLRQSEVWATVAAAYRKEAMGSDYATALLLAAGQADQCSRYWLDRDSMASPEECER